MCSDMEDEFIQPCGVCRQFLCEASWTVIHKELCKLTCSQNERTHYALLYTTNLYTTKHCVCTNCELIYIIYMYVDCGLKCMIDERTNTLCPTIYYKPIYHKTLCMH
jgi:hypothetical protein